MIKNLILFLALLASTSLCAQDIGYGFKAGLNFNQILSDSELDANGNELEDFSGNTGFHVGVAFTWKATDLMGVRGEALYSQKGGRRKYNGPSYYTFYNDAGDRINSTGIRELELNISFSYIEIPVVGYFKPVPWFEVYAGPSIGFMVSATTFGDLEYNGTTAGGTAIETLSYEIDGNYFTDDAREADFLSTPETIKIGNQNIVKPRSAGVYYEFQRDRGNLYKIIDLGAVGGASIYLNQGLYISGRVVYGLTDITKSEADVSLFELEGEEFIERDDDDRNFSVQASIGFSF